MVARRMIVCSRSHAEAGYDMCVCNASAIIANPTGMDRGTMYRQYNVAGCSGFFVSLSPMRNPEGLSSPLVVIPLLRSGGLDNLIRDTSPNAW